MLHKFFNIENGDVVTVVGSGGKTSFINKVLQGLHYNKILITTTTKVLKNEFSLYDCEVVGKSIYSYDFSNNGRYLVYNEELEDSKKLVGFDKKILDTIVNNFNVSIIEGDGSRRKKLKGWKPYEPVIINKTTKTIGIINLKLIVKNACDKYIHNITEFLTISNLKKNDIIDEVALVNLICHRDGLFKDSIGEKILFINQLDSNAEFVYGEIFSKKVLERLDIKIVIGSLHNDYYKVIRS